jgi:membrane fusion protein (multidrug efflux system)
MTRSIVISASVFVLLLAGCSKPAPSGPPPGGFSMPVEAVVAAVERVEDKIAAVGTLAPNESVQIKAEVEGRIVTVSFEEGKQVSKGDVLFKLDDAKLQAQLDAAQARLTRARSNLERSRDLLQTKAISTQEFDDAQAEFKEAHALVTLATKQLQDATIVSPFKGFVSQRLVSAGKYVDRGETLVTIVDIDPIKADFNVPERHLALLRIGQSVAVMVAALPGRRFAGTVYFIDPRVEDSTRTVKVRATVPNPEGLLRPGMFANAELIAGTRDNAVVIPEKALVPLIDKVIVFVVENGTALRREVTIGQRMPGKVEITTGVKAGETVVVAGQQKLRDQTPVAVLPPQG